jgi:hypothetical protein
MLIMEILHLKSIVENRNAAASVVATDFAKYGGSLSEKTGYCGRTSGILAAYLIVQHRIRI